MEPIGKLQRAPVRRRSFNRFDPLYYLTVYLRLIDN